MRKACKGQAMKQIPNILCILRICLSVSLLFVEPFSGLFLAFYLLCGFSDMIDGTIARKTNSASEFGARLDSIADVIFMAVLVYILVPVMKVSWRIWIFIAVIAVIRLASLLITYFKFRKIAMLHTYANKAAGFALFCFPALYSFVNPDILAAAVCTVVCFSAVEELLIQIQAKELNRDVKGIFVGK